MAQLAEEGKIRYIGVSNFDTAQMQQFERTQRIDSLQPPYDLFRRDIEQAILPYCREYGIVVVVYGPLVTPEMLVEIEQIMRDAEPIGEPAPGPCRHPKGRQAPTWSRR
jgi:diketogulonate reductase-like aldo/keto reductase